MTANQLQLITAAVDGELSATETRAFRLLLANSAEARVLFAKLKTDSECVRALPRVVPPADLQAKILAKLAGVPAPRVRPQPHADPTAAPGTIQSRFPSWVPVAVAASVFLCLATASFAYFTTQGAPNYGTVKQQWSNVLPAPQEGSTVPSPTQPLRPDLANVVRSEVLPVPTPRPLVSDVIAVAPEPRSVPAPDFVGFPTLPKLPPIERIEVRLPFLRPVTDLGREDINQELLDQLRQDRQDRDLAFRFDVFARDTGRGVEVFQNAAKASGLALFADAATVEKLKKKQTHAILIYTESFTADELAKLFAKLSTEDAKFSPKVCDSLHATPVVRSEELELRAILGVDVGLFKRPVGSGVGADKSVSSGTIDSVVKAVSKPGEKVAVMLTWQTTYANIPRTNPAISAELKTFLARRGDRKPNAVPSIIIIRPVG